MNRSKKMIAAQDFKVLTDLHLKYEWLEDEPEALSELWQLSENDEQKELIKFLVEKFCYIDSRKSRKSCKEIVNQIENVWELSPVNTRISAICDGRKQEPDGSQAFIYLLKNKFSNDWKKNVLYNSFPKNVHKVSENSNIVLVDDFIGTGDTICRKVNYLKGVVEKRKLQNVAIYVISLGAMCFAKEVLESLDISYFSANWIKKGISEQILDQANKAKAIKAMESLEEKLFVAPRYKFGYKRSESLFAWESYNIPNNVFPIFWWNKLANKEIRKTIFRRIS